MAWEPGDPVWFSAAHRSAHIARHDIGTVVSADAKQVTVAVRGGRQVTLAAGAPSLRQGLVVPPLPSLYARAQEVYAVGVKIRHPLVHHYVAADVALGPPSPGWMRTASGSELAASAGAITRTQRRARSARTWVAEAERRLARATTPTARAAWGAQLAAARADLPVELPDADALHHQIRLRGVALGVASAFGGSPELTRTRVLDRRAELALAI
jgi:hypothetical protein